MCIVVYVLRLCNNCRIAKKMKFVRTSLIHESNNHPSLLLKRKKLEFSDRQAELWKYVLSTWKPLIKQLPSIALIILCYEVKGSPSLLVHNCIFCIGLLYFGLYYWTRLIFNLIYFCTRSNRIQIILKLIYFCTRSYRIQIILRLIYFCTQSNRIQIILRLIYFCTRSKRIQIIFKLIYFCTRSKRIQIFFKLIYFCTRFYRILIFLRLIYLTLIGLLRLYSISIILS